MIDVVGIVTARAGSKGFPGKHLALLGGKPLIAWTLDAARASRHLRRAIVSTDDDRLAEVCRAMGMEVPFCRPSELATDHASHVDVIEHALQWLNAAGDHPEYVLLLQPTSPFRSGSDIDAAIDLADRSSADAVVGVYESEKHPYKMFRRSDHGTLVPFVTTASMRRQDMPPALAENGAIYLNRCDAFLKTRSFIPDNALPYLMPRSRSVDIDTPEDLRLAEYLLARAEKC